MANNQPVQLASGQFQPASGQSQLASGQSQLVSGQSRLGYTQLNFSQLQWIKIKIKEMCLSNSDYHFDTPLHYTETIFMEIQHFCACGDTTIQHANQSSEWHQQQQSNPEEAAPFKHI